jgi:hypothetical protein
VAALYFGKETVYLTISAIFKLMTAESSIGKTTVDATTSAVSMQLYNSDCNTAEGCPTNRQVTVTQLVVSKTTSPTRETVTSTTVPMPVKRSGVIATL